jgi:alpha,alpha-trehalase
MSALASRPDIALQHRHPFALAPIILALAIATGACHAPARPAAATSPSSASTTGTATSFYAPARDLGALFADVQMAAIFPDSKTFADAVPHEAPATIAARYAAERTQQDFDLATFVHAHFDVPAAPPSAAPAAGAPVATSMESHIAHLWSVLVRPPDRRVAHSSLIPLPAPYVVPGGRFREMYYWDSYFTMLGLVQSNRLDLVKDLLDDFAYLIRTVGHVPNGTRAYYMSRSQPPFFGAMVALYASKAGVAAALPYLDALEREHAFWMDGSETLEPGTAFRRVVRLPNGAVLNRYWDDRADPRPESYKEDVRLAASIDPSARPALYRNLRAAAESGWDFSSRWMRDPTDLRTLETVDLAPVDLNSILYESERTIARLHASRGAKGDDEAARRFATEADARRRALVAAAYDPATGDFYDVRWRTGARVSDRPTMAAAAPLYFGLATPDQARAVAAHLERDFLKPGGFVTSTVASGQQWDAPNGWAPLEWMAIEGLRRYGIDDLADRARSRWLALNRRTYAATGKMMEKYDVVDRDTPAGGGEYPGQDGFGWTNGVALALSAEAAGTSRVPATQPAKATLPVH